MRDFNLSKESSELLASRLGEHGVLDSGTKITFYRNRNDLLLRFFTMDPKMTLYFVTISQAFFAEMGSSKYNLDEWRLFIVSSKGSLKCVLLHKGNKFACFPIGHSVVVKEHYLNVKWFRTNWATVSITGPICVEFKMVNFLL